MSGASQEMYDGFFSAIENRRSYYGIKKESSISDEELVSIVKRSVKFVPTSFNMQQSRAVVFTGAHHDKLWDIICEISDKNTPDEGQRKAGRGKIEGCFKAGYGSVVFFEDQDVVKNWSNQMPAFSKGFEIWSEDSSSMLQYVVWTALEAKGLGATLQHYSDMYPEVQGAVAKAFELPESWKCRALMPFGVPAGPPGNPGHPKEFQSVDERVKHFLA